MRGSRFPRRAGLVAVVVVLMLVAGAGGAAAGVAYLKLGMSNTSNVTTTLTGATNGAELSVRNTRDHPALALTVPAGVPPLRVNSNGNVANLNADLLDGFDSANFARGKGMKTLAIRRVVPNTAGYPELLRIPNLGVLSYGCRPGIDVAEVNWTNDGADPIDAWRDFYGDWTGTIASTGLDLVVVEFDGTTRVQHGSTIHLGQGNDAVTRRIADIRVHAYRGGTDQAVRVRRHRDDVDVPVVDHHARASDSSRSRRLRSGSLITESRSRSRTVPMPGPGGMPASRWRSSPLTARSAMESGTFRSS